MIAAWMVYCIGIGLAFVVVGHALERALQWAGQPTRWAWIVALTGTLVLPMAAWVAPAGFRTMTVPLDEPTVERPAREGVLPPAGVTAAVAPTLMRRAFASGDLNRLLVWGWGLGSGAVLLVIFVGALRLAVLRRQWRVAVADGHPVLLSNDVGPAVTGLSNPRIVIPSWVLDLPVHHRRLVLLHEEEHLRAGDPWLLALGMLGLVLAPWHPAVWWQVRRLRLAVEMDCDARVVARTGRHAAPAYADLLLAVGARRVRQPLATPALGEPASFLGRRIRRLATALPRWRWGGAVVALAIAAAALVAACEAPRPVAPRDSDEARGRQEFTGDEIWTWGEGGITGIVVVDKVSTESAVDAAPERLSGPPIVYPALLKHAGIEGLVQVEAVIDVAGRVEPRSVRVVTSPHPALSQAAITGVQRWVFSPARVGERSARVGVRLSIRFTLFGQR